MELIQTSIGQILSIISENFWQIFLIISMLLVKRYRTPAMMILLFQMIFGYKWFIYVAGVITALCTDCVIDTKTQSLVDAIEKIENRIKDPDYK